MSRRANLWRLKEIFWLFKTGESKRVQDFFLGNENVLNVIVMRGAQHKYAKILYTLDSVNCSFNKAINKTHKSGHISYLPFFFKLNITNFFEGSKMLFSLIIFNGCAILIPVEYHCIYTQTHVFLCIWTCVYVYTCLHTECLRSARLLDHPY